MPEKEKINYNDVLRNFLTFIFISERISNILRIRTLGTFLCDKIVRMEQYAASSFSRISTYEGVLGGYYGYSRNGRRR